MLITLLPHVSIMMQYLAVLAFCLTIKEVCTYFRHTPLYYYFYLKIYSAHMLVIHRCSYMYNGLIENIHCGPQDI